MADAQELLKPGLYDAKGTAALPGNPSLLGGRCNCGHVFFPMQNYGCEKCGASADHLKPHRLAGSGKILALATVHLHAGKGRQAPFTVATIALDDGPTVRTLLDQASERDAKPGLAVVTKLIDVPREDGPALLDLRFALR